ncbi:hypothetical protein [Virgibacillus sp. DJP39]
MADKLSVSAGIFLTLAGKLPKIGQSDIIKKRNGTGLLILLPFLSFWF